MKKSFTAKLILTTFLLINPFLSFLWTVYGQTNSLVMDKSGSRLNDNKKIELILGPSLLYPLGNFNQETNPRRLMTGYSFGIGFRQFRSNRFEIISRLLYERKGYKTENTNVDSIGNISQVYNTQKLDYVSLSVLPTIAFDKSKRSKLLCGVYFSLLTQDSFKQEAFLNGQYSFSYFAKNVGGRFNSYDYGISIGACHSRNINDTFDLGLQLLTNIGLNNIVPKDFPGVVIKPSSLSLSLILTYNN